MVTKTIKDSNKQSEKKAEISNKNKKTNTPRFRICSKKEPLQPLNIGIKIKPKNPSVKCSLVNRRKPVKNKVGLKQKVNTKKISKAEGKSIKHKQNVKRPPVQKTKQSNRKVVPAIKVVDTEADFQSEVVFNQNSNCEACLDGRKGEGDQSCWACRLTRLKNISQV